ncbi:MAG: ImmA/IrrE family metallo-endopeptidase [Sphingobacteriales bacterium]|nr:ImmA/IrrE family metallo-endopeptidase [Sphingobacteriales bacterium]
MSSTLTEIEDLAEFIAEQYLVNGKVDLDRIASDKDITIIHEKYGPYFLGQLVHENGNFFLHLNSDKLPDIRVPRARFTLAHDYGHYFIDNHRNQLKKGISLAFTTENPLVKKPPHEIEADHFASHLLMPKKNFINTAKTLEPGMDSVLQLKNIFDSSIECTAIHYVKLDIFPCMFIRWKADPSQHYCFRSDSLAKLTGLSKRPIINVHKEYLQSLFLEIDTTLPRPDYIENVSPLSRWVSSIAPGSKADLMGLEQTFKLGEYGGITFLLF